MTGKTRRLARLFTGPANRCLLVPLDHGPWMGPAKGIDRPHDIVRRVMAGGANALLTSPGFTRSVQSMIRPEVAIVLRTSITAGLAPGATQETPIATVETALCLDADAVAASIFFGRGGEIEQLRYMGSLVEDSHRYGMPVLAEMMPPDDRLYNPEAISHAARIGYELGADVIKTNYCGDIGAFRDVVAASPVPIIVAGGPDRGDGSDGVLRMLQDVIDAGAAGVAFGRRVWQAPDPEGLVRQMAEIMFAGE